MPLVKINGEHLLADPSLPSYGRQKAGCSLLQFYSLGQGVSDLICGSQGLSCISEQIGAPYILKACSSSGRAPVLSKRELGSPSAIKEGEGDGRATVQNARRVWKRAGRNEGCERKKCVAEGRRERRHALKFSFCLLFENL